MIGSTGNPISGHLSATSSIDFAAVTAGQCATSTITVTGAVAGDSAYLGVIPASIMGESGLVPYAYVSGDDTVTVMVCQIGTNDSGDPAAGVFRADVWKH